MTLSRSKSRSDVYRVRNGFDVFYYLRLLHHFSTKLKPLVSSTMDTSRHLLTAREEGNSISLKIEKLGCFFEHTSVRTSIKLHEPGLSAGLDYVQTKGQNAAYQYPSGVSVFSGFMDLRGLIVCRRVSEASQTRRHQRGR